MNPTNGDDDEEGTESGSTWTGCSTNIFFSTNCYNLEPRRIMPLDDRGKKRNSTFTLETEAETFLSIETKKKIEKRNNVQFLLKQKHYHKVYFLKLALNKC